MNVNKLFLEKKCHRNPKACVRIHTYTHACLSSTCACYMHAYAYTGIRAHARVPKTMKEKFSAFKTWFGMNPTLFGSHSKPLFSDYKKLYMVFKRQKIRREIFTEHPQVNIFLIETFSNLNL